jgi:diaminopimelate decarboxylase
LVFQFQYSFNQSPIQLLCSCQLCVHINQQLALHGFDDCGAGNGKSSLRVMATPGRFLAASVFSLITNVVDKRPVDASAVTNNGGIFGGIRK